jgi:retron-type reverse transcriptase
MISSSSLEYLIRSAPYRYKVFDVEKKGSVEKRQIAQPARELKALQYWMMDNVLKAFPVHRAAMAYLRGRGIKANAEKHAGQSYLLKLDFADFFHSITATDLEAYLKAKHPDDWSAEEINYFKKIFFWNRGRAGKLILSIGAPSSPMISNILMCDFDKAVQEYCVRKKVKYTRYADDLTFSTNRPNILREVKVQVELICKEMKHPRLTINEKKTVHASKGGSRRVTGLVLSNEGTISLGRDRKRLIRTQVHHFLTGQLSVDETNKLRGMLAFVNSCEPEFLERLRKAYGDEGIDHVMRFPLD